MVIKWIFKAMLSLVLAVLILLYPHKVAGITVAALGAAVIAAVVFVERAQRRITVNYAPRQQGRKMFQGQSSHLPLKVNMAGVIPAIFASSFLLFPASLGQWFGQNEGYEFLAVQASP